MTTTPVGDDHTIEAPILFQDLIEHDLIMAVVLVFIEIIRTHDRPRLSLLHSSLKGRQVDLVEGTVADDDIHLMTVFLVVVQGIVLHTGCHTLRLETLDIGHHHARGQPGILAHILEVATSEWRTIDVHTRTQHHTLSSVECLLAQALAIETGHGRIPRSSQTGKGWEGHARVVGLSCLLPLVPQHVRTHTMRTIVRPKVRESQTLHTRR